MMGWLILRDIVPKLYLGAPPGYKRLEAEPAKPTVQQMGIHFAGRRIGYSRTTLTVLANGEREIRSKTRVDFVSTLLPTAFDLLVRLDNQGRLKNFDGSMKAKTGQIPLRGRVADSQLIIEEPRGLDAMPYDNSTPLDIPFSSVLDMTNLRVGKRWRITQINLFQGLGSVQYALARVVGEETITAQDKSRKTFVVEVTLGDYEIHRTRMWIDADGVVLKQELPFRITLIRETPDDTTEERDEALRR